jgi:hypothetical protein
VDSRQTDAAGLTRGGELCLFIWAHDDCSSKEAPELLDLSAEVRHLLTQADNFLLVGMGVEDAKDGLGLAVDGLSGNAASGRMPGNGTLWTVKGNGGAGQACERL